MSDEKTAATVRHLLHQVDLTNIKLSLRKADVLSNGRRAIREISLTADSFVGRPNDLYKNLKAYDLKAPGAPTNQVIQAFKKHPLAQEAAAVVEQASAVLTTTPARSTKRKTQHGVEFFSWRHIYLQHGYRNDVSTIWRWHVRLSIPKAPSITSDNWVDAVPTVSVSLVDAWELVTVETAGHLQIAKEIRAMLQAIAFDLAVEALENFDFELEQLTDGGISPIPVFLEFSVAPATIQHAKALQDVVNLFGTKSATHPLIDPYEITNSYPNLVVIGHEFCLLSQYELQDILSTESATPPAPKSITARPGEAYTLLEGECSTVLLTATGKVVIAEDLRRYKQIVSLFGMRPKDLVSRYRVDTEEFKNFEPKPARGTFLLFHEKLIRWLEGVVDEDSLDRIEYLAEAISDAHYAVQVKGSGPALRLRVIADQTSRVSYGWLSPEGAPFGPDIERAISGGFVSPLSGKPVTLMAAASLCACHPEINQWCAANSVELKHPKSGFAGGIHFMKHWREELIHRRMHKDIHRIETSRDFIFFEEDLPSLAATNLMLENQAWIGALDYLSGEARLIRSGIPTARNVDWSSYCAAMRPHDNMMALMRSRAAWLETLPEPFKARGTPTP